MPKKSKFMRYEELGIKTEDGDTTIKEEPIEDLSTVVEGICDESGKRLHGDSASVCSEGGNGHTQGAQGFDVPSSKCEEMCFKEEIEDVFVKEEPMEDLSAAPAGPSCEGAGERLQGDASSLRTKEEASEDPGSEGTDESFSTSETLRNYKEEEKDDNIEERRPFSATELLELLGMGVHPEAFFGSVPGGPVGEGGFPESDSPLLLTPPVEVIMRRGEREVISFGDSDESSSEPSSDGHQLTYEWSKVEDANVAKKPLFTFEDKNPLEVFEFFWDPNFLSDVVVETKRHAQQNGTILALTTKDVKKVIGILLLSGYLKLPHWRLYWSKEKYYRVECVYKVMSIGKFDKILRFIRFPGRENSDRNDGLYHLRPLIDHLNWKFQQAFPLETSLCFGESMIECLFSDEENHVPIMSGYKTWYLNTSLGYNVSFDICQLVKAEPEGGGRGTFGQGGAALLACIDKLLSHIKALPLRFILHEDVTSLPLLEELRFRSFGATGFIREDRIPANCPVVSLEEMKKQEMGHIDAAFAHQQKTSVVRWREKRVVTVASTTASVHPIDRVGVRLRADRRHVQIQRPAAVAELEKPIEGKRRMEENLDLYRISIRRNNWAWSIFTWMLDVSVQNSWLLHQATGSKMDLLCFRRYITLALLGKDPAPLLVEEGVAPKHAAPTIKPHAR